MTSLMTSPGHKIGQILKLIYLRQYLSYSVDQKLKMSQMLMAIFLVYSTSGITSGKKVCRAQNGGHFENFEILNTASIWPQIWKDPTSASYRSHDHYQHHAAGADSRTLVLFLHHTNDHISEKWTWLLENLWDTMASTSYYIYHLVIKKWITSNYKT